MNARRNHVMNDDILGIIFKRLDIKDLFSLQRVSQQFNDCVKEVLQKKKELSFGFNDLKNSSIVRCFKKSFKANDWHRIDITPAISLKGINHTHDINRCYRVVSIVRQFCGVRKLYLSTAVISFKTLELMVSEWPQLEALYIYGIDICGPNDKTITEWTQLLSKVKVIEMGSIDTKYVSFLKEIIANLPSLRSVNVWGLRPNTSHQTITISLLTDCLSASIQSLHIGMTPADSHSLDVITRKCPQIRKLSIYESFIYSFSGSFHLWNQWFAMVCDRLKGLTYLKLILANISTKEFAESIQKLNHLQSLHINCFVYLYFKVSHRMCFDTQEMAKYMPPMVSLKTLSLREMKCSPNRWSNMADMLPNVRQLSVDYMYYCMDCTEGDQCFECFYRCMDFVSKMPKLKHMNIYHTDVGQITRHSLDLFADMDHLSIDWGKGDLVEELIHFILFTLDNRRRVFRLDLCPHIRRQLVDRMATIGVPMPGCLIVSHIFILIDLQLV